MASPRQMQLQDQINVYHHQLGTLDIVKESVAALRHKSSRFAWLALLLATPYSAAVLSQVVVVAPSARRLASSIVQIEQPWLSLAAPPSLYTPACFRLADVLVSHAFQLPFVVLLALPARAAVAWTIAAAARPPPSSAALRPASIWCRAVATYVWICFLMLACIVATLAALALVAAASRAAGLSPDVLLFFLLLLLLPFCLLFAHLVIVSNLAVTVSILETSYGPASIMKAILLLRGRTQVALLLFLLSTTAAASVDSLFQYRVLGVPGYGYAIDLSSKLWEVPLLVAMYSFFYLFDSIASTIFYFTCNCETMYHAIASPCV